MRGFGLLAFLGCILALLLKGTPHSLCSWASLYNDADAVSVSLLGTLCIEQCLPSTAFAEYDEDYDNVDDMFDMDPDWQSTAEPWETTNSDETKKSCMSRSLSSHASSSLLLRLSLVVGMCTEYGYPAD
eukprot:6206069-Pleurochrysis_carterae.AAC.5